MGVYLKYVTNYLIRKVAFWIVILTYIFVFSIICLIIPAVNKIYFLWAWVTEFRSLNIILEYLIALYGAIVAIFIFRAPIDDGSELLISSKPIQRNKLICSKFIIFTIVCIFYGLLSGLFACFGFLLPTNYWSVISLTTSLFIISFIFSLLYGGIAILSSINHGKLWMISWNMVLVLLTNIIFFVGAAGLKEPSAVITDSKTITSSQVSFINHINQQVNSEYFINLTGTDISDIPDLDWQKNIYQNSVKKSTSKIIYPFDVTGHMYSMSNLGYLDYVRKQINGSCRIGQSLMFDYKINNLVHKYPLNSLSDTYNDDNYEEWTEFGLIDSPLFYTQYSNLKREDLAKFVNINTSTDINNELFELLEQIIVNHTVVFPSGIFSNSNNDNASIMFDAPYIDTRFIFEYDDPWSKTPSYSVGKFFNGSSNIGNMVFMNSKMMEPTITEKDLFDYLIYELMFDVDSELYNCINKSSIYYHFNLKTDNGQPSNYLIYKHIYNILSNKNVTQKLNLNSDYDYALEIYKFKYYLSRQLLGCYGIKNVFCTNWLNPSSEKITVPYEYYFRLVFIPQYNAYTVRNIDDFNTSIEIPIDININPREIFRYGGFVLPSLPNWLSWVLTNDLTGKKLRPISCEYDGNEVDVSYFNDKPKLKGLFQIYDLSKTDWSVVKDKFGYFSELGIKIDTLLNDFAFKRRPIYLKDGYTNLYSSLISSNSVQLLIYQHMLFSYTCSEKYNPYMLLVIYLIIDLLILSIGYVAHIRHDVK